MSMKLHIGCGPIKLDGYINIDIEPSHNPDVCGNVLDLSYQDVDVIYTCHMIEHLSVSDAQAAFDCFYKWLKPNGILRIGVPSLELATQAYVNGNDMSFIYGRSFNGYYLYDTPCERFNFFMKEWEHKITYDFNQLHLMLLKVGFWKIKKAEANQTDIPNFNHDRFISESLYVEAIK